jgi:Na+/H+-dicarboxylate symporter
VQLSKKSKGQDMLKAIYGQWSRLGILGQIIVAAVAAVITGIFFPELGLMVKPWGALILRLIKMIIVPLIFFSIAKAVIDIKDATKAAKMGIGSFLLYSLTTCLATFWAVIISAPIFARMTLPDLTGLQTTNIDQIISNASGYGGFWDAIFRIVPSNMLESFVSGNTLSVIFFAVVAGFLVLQMMGSKDHKKEGEVLEKFIGACSTLIYRFINVVVAMMPLAVYAYLSWMIAAQDASLIAALARMIGVGYMVLICHMVLTYGGLMAVAGLSFFTFIRKFFPVQLFAYSTASSAATIPLNERRLTTRLGVSSATAGFVVPFGATVNMDGTAICQVVYAIFIAKLYGVSLGVGSYVMLAVMSSIISIGVAAVPSASLVTLGVVLGVVGLPIEGIGIIVATDRILDMARTAINVTGDGVVAVVMDKVLGRHDKKAFNA